MTFAPQHYYYEYAQRVAQRFAQIRGTDALAAHAPVRIASGWWSPLFPFIFLFAPQKQAKH
jgi:hypothetical protein